MKQRKIGILGGTFDPIHKAHVRVAEAAGKQFDLDEVWIMPTGYSYFKAERGQASYKVHRANMVKLAAAGKKNIIFSDFEINRSGATYTAETLAALTAEYPEDKFYFILGADSVKDMIRWYKPELIFQNAVILAAGRAEQVGTNVLQEKIAELQRIYKADIRLIDTEEMPVSSSELRERISRGEDVSEWVDDQVLAYIQQHFLYQELPELSAEAETVMQNCSCSDREWDILRMLRHMLKPERVIHSLGVMETSCKMAQQYGVSFEQARLAGLLHDCGKYRGTALTHGAVGAELAESLFYVQDSEVLNAIRFHTTGRPAMTELEKIVYIADYIEPNRRMIPGLEECRKKAYEDLDQAAALIAGNTLKYLKSTGCKIDPATEETYRYYEKKISR